MNSLEENRTDQDIADKLKDRIMEGGGWCRAMGQIHLDVVPEVQRRCTIVIGRVGMVYSAWGCGNIQRLESGGHGKLLVLRGGSFGLP